MKPLGLGEHGGITVIREGSGYVAYVRYRDYAGRGRRLKRSGPSKAAASRNVLRAVREVLGADGDGEISRTSTLQDAARGWLSMFAGLVDSGARSPSTLDEYRYVLDRVILPEIGSLRLGEVTTPRLDRFVQAVIADRGYATAKLSRSVLSGICGWSVRRGVLSANPVRDLTPLELDRDRTARPMSVQEMRDWLALLDANEFAQRHDLPELARFMLATGLRLGEALGVTWSDVDLAAGTIAVRRTVVGVKRGGLSPNGSSLGRPSGDSSYRRGASSCCGLGGCGWAPSTARCFQTRGVVGGTGATSVGRSGPCGAAPTSNG